MTRRSVLGLLVYTGFEMDSCAGVTLGVGELPGGGRAGLSRQAGPCVEPGLRSDFLPSAAARALYLLAAIPLAPFPPPDAWAGISKDPDVTFHICWGWGRARGSRGCVQAFSITPCSRDGRPSPEVLVCSAVFFNRSPNTHKNDGCALYFPALFFSTWSRWLVVKPLAWAPPAPARGSLRCLGMLRPGAADGNSILNGSDDAVRAGELFAPAPMPESHLLVLHRDATLGANTHPCHPARSPSPRGRALGQTLGLFLQGSGGPEPITPRTGTGANPGVISAGKRWSGAHHPEDGCWGKPWGYFCRKAVVPGVLGGVHRDAPQNLLPVERMLWWG